MYQIPVNSDPYQEQTFEFNGVKIRLTLRYNSVGEYWMMDVFEPVLQKQICTGIALSVGVPILWRGTQPYYFWLSDESGFNLDPVNASELGYRCLLYIGEK